jgi:hypothetical protein
MSDSTSFKEENTISALSSTAAISPSNYEALKIG